ncbi:carbohydrate ABC transporter permease [Curtobacterium sp. MCBD17_034]|uniref:carbohydrate ABC transporter permease n=1 Tax=unclassified Curtobacterium TaxID=257496 RepID=UPI000DAA97C6|nr:MULTISPECIES: carbohydrate ABC transporter permease [unclassified Curtobacterium]PZF56184.1 carbohydrate ABC transporter permease [Curtobacterium sp. MCBD17_034]PZM32951.1 carbohydrate ABC transporter permease [Curtobacterium sp. MCBD17_031]
MSSAIEAVPVVDDRGRSRAASTTAVHRRRTDWGLIGLWIGLVVAAIIWIVPFLFMFITSVKSQADVANLAPWALPTHWEWGNFAAAASVGNIWQSGLNSIIIAVIKVPLGLMISAMAAFALARLRFRWQRVLLGLIALGTLIPVQVALGPLFSTMLDLNLLNTKIGLILPYLAFGVSYQVFILYGFFKAIPEELDEAARIDGASNWRLFWQVIIPLAKPALAALFILDFVSTWNEYPMALTLLQTTNEFTIPLGITNFQTQYGSNYPQLNAYIIMSILPVLIVYLMFQRYFVRGALAGAVKG